MPKRHHHKDVGRYRTVAVPLHRTGDVEALLAMPDIDWKQVRACPKGRRSPPLDIVGGRKVSRTQVIRAFLQGFGADYHIEMWGWWVPGPDVWEIDWERIPGGLTTADVAAAIDGNPVLRRHRSVIRLHSEVGIRLWWLLWEGGEGVGVRGVDGRVYGVDAPGVVAAGHLAGGSGDGVRVSAGELWWKSVDGVEQDNQGGGVWIGEPGVQEGVAQGLPQCGFAGVIESGPRSQRDEAE